MNLLSDDDKALLVLEHLGPAALAGDTMSLYDCFQLALDVAEKAVLAKLAAKELPEPFHLWRHEDACGDEVARPTPMYRPPNSKNGATPDTHRALQRVLRHSLRRSLALGSGQQTSSMTAWRLTAHPMTPTTKAR